MRPVAPVSAVSYAAAMRTPLFLVAVCLTGCLSSAPVVTQTPANAAQIASCENTATMHNDLLIGDFVLTASGAGLGTVGALASDTTTKTDLAIAAAGVGAAAVLTSALVGLTTSNFQNSKCGDVVGPLPAGPLPATKAPDETTVTVSKP